MALDFPVFGRNVRPLWIRDSQKAVECGEPERVLIRVPTSGRVGIGVEIGYKFFPLLLPP